MAMQRGIIPFEAGVTSTPEWKGVDFKPITELVFGGWDIEPRTALDAALDYGVLAPNILNKMSDSSPLLSPMSGARLPSDFSVTGNKKRLRQQPLQEVLKELRENIRAFKAKHTCEKVIVVLLLPAERGFGKSFVNGKEIDPFKAIKQNQPEKIRAGHLYSLAAVMEGCGVIDFTASTALESIALQKLASKNHVPLAGRDGSTGQTIMKAHLAELFRQRGLKVMGWYSTNLIGNPDGLVLSHTEFQSIKMRDKLQPLPLVLGYPVSDHVVRIDYFPPRGDNKEAWDAVDLRAWTGGIVQVKINWLGRDSLVAAPLLLDLIRLMDHQNTWKHAGIASQLGYFFKHPLGTDERAPSVLWRYLLDFYGARA
jgi:myo-inositol-1-phosphate synthase